MLKRFEVEGFKGFSKRLVFDLTAHDYAFNPNLVKDGIVKNCLVYGPNGIGKTNLGLALFDVVSHLTDKEPMDKKYLVEYKNLEVPAEELVEFRYVFEFGEIGDIVYEYAKDAKRELIWERLTSGKTLLVYWNYLNSAENYLERNVFKTINVELPDNKLSVLKYLYRNIPTDNAPALTRVMLFVENMLWYRSLSDGNNYAGFSNGDASLDDMICKLDKLQDFERFLSAHGINFKLSKKLINNEFRILVKFPQTGRLALFGNIASTGTKTLLLFYYWSVVSADRASFLFIDEFDAFFHYQSAASIVKQLNNSNFQVALTSHNTYLMQNEFTRPDCCFLMSHCCIKSLPECTDREIRQAHNLEKMYINGVFTG